MSAVNLSILIAMIILVIGLAAGVNVGVILGVAAMVGTYICTGRINTALNLAFLQSFSVNTTFSFIVIPLFVLMASLASETNITEGLFKAAYRWLGKLPGGACLATIATCAGMAALTGSSAATAATMSRLALPELKKYNYDTGMAVGSCCVGGTLAIMIPPSITFVLYSMFAEQSIGKLLMAGILPGVILALLFCFMIVLRVKRNPNLAPASPDFTRKEKFQSLVGIIPFLLLIIFMCVGIIAGICTPVEAAALGVIFVFVFGIIGRTITLKKMVKALVESVVTSASIMMVVIGSMMFGQYLALTGFSDQLTKYIINLHMPNLLFFLILMVIYLILGMFLEATSILALTVPLLTPVVIAIGWSPIWFGVVMVLMMEVATVTPPVGLNLYAVKATSPDIPIGAIFSGSVPYLICCAILLVILYVFKGLPLIIPNLML